MDKCVCVVVGVQGCVNIHKSGNSDSDVMPDEVDIRDEMREPEKDGR